MDVGFLQGSAFPRAGDGQPGGPEVRLLVRGFLMRGFLRQGQWGLTGHGKPGSQAAGFKAGVELRPGHGQSQRGQGGSGLGAWGSRGTHLHLVLLLGSAPPPTSISPSEDGRTGGLPRGLCTLALTLLLLRLGAPSLPLALSLLPCLAWVPRLRRGLVELGETCSGPGTLACSPALLLAPTHPKPPVPSPRRPAPALPAAHRSRSDLGSVSPAAAAPPLHLQVPSPSLEPPRL